MMHAPRWLVAAVNGAFRSLGMEDRVIRVLQRASETTGPDLNPFKAIWTQWEIEGAPPGDSITVTRPALPF